MNRPTSLYLDVIRFSAALAVFLGHLSGHRFTDGLFWQFGPYMAEAVTVFFVLSGFVIGYAADKGENSPATYFTARAARIYSVALPALALTFALDAAGRTLRPDLYAVWWGYVWDGRLWQFLSGALFLNEIWLGYTPQGSDLPYWSLGYEVWYYAIFGIALFAPARWRVAGTVAALALAGPKIAVMFPLWLLGLFCYRLCARGGVNRAVATLLCLGCALGWIAYELWAWRHTRFTDVVPVFLGRPELIQDYIIALLFAGHILGFHSLAGTFVAPLLNRFARQIRWIAGSTFTLYLFHLPVAQFLTTLMPWPPHAWPTRIVLLAGTFTMVLLIAEVTERRKEIWRRGIAAMVARLAPAPS